MNELDDNGWGHIHHAAFRGFVKSIERFVKANHDQLELETTDDSHSTPLLLAVQSGNLETVKCLVDIGANISAINSQNHGVVELSALRQYIHLLEYFIEKDDPKLPVWKNLLRFLSSDSDEEAEAAGKCLRRMTQGSEEQLNPNWEAVHSHGGIPILVKVIKGNIGDDAKLEAFHVILNMIQRDEIKEQIVSSGGIAAIVRLLKSGNNFVVQLAAQTLKELCKVKQYSVQATQNGAIPALVKVIQNTSEPEVLVEVVSALGNIAESNPSHQNTIGSTNGAISAIVSRFDECSFKPLLMALTETVTKICERNAENQNALVGEGVSSQIICLIKVKNKDIQLAAVEAVQKLAEGNGHTQRHILEEGVVKPLLDLLKRTRQQNLQERTAGALWALAGSHTEERRLMASMVGVQTLIEFLNSMSVDLHYIGSEGTGVLAQGPISKQTAIAHANGVHPLVRLLRSDKEYIVLSVIRTLRYLCVGVGFVPHPQNQQMIAQSRGIKFLVALMVHSRNEQIQAESAVTLGYVALGNPENLEEIQQNMDFSYVRILKMLYSRDDLVRLLAGSALAAFAYNSLQQQKEIAEQGGVRFSCFVPFLQSDDEYFRCTAAFQVVVLARIIPDEEQALSSAAGIKLLVDLLQDSKSSDILALTCDCIARLAHTRAGIPSAFVSIEAVDLLCQLMLNTSEQVRGNAAVALGYLSYNHIAERQLLNRCRVDPYLMKVLTYFTKSHKLSPEFMEEWKHYKRIGLPPIEEGRTKLTTRKSIYLKDFEGPPLTITSAEATDNASSNAQTSPTNKSTAQQDDTNTQATGKSSRRSSRVSNTTMPSISQRPTSMASDLSRHSTSLSHSVATPEITAQE